MSAHVRDFDGVALIARETDRAGHAPLFPEANSNRFEQWPPSMLSILWAGAGPPGGTVRRAAVRKRGSGSQSLSEHRLPE